MNLLDRINEFILLFVDTVRQVPRFKIWLPLVAYFLVQWFALYAHYNFLQPPFYELITSWVSLIGPDQADAFAHYPQHFLLLGRFAGWAKLAIGLILEGLVLGLVAGLFHVRFTGDASPTYRQRPLLIRWLNLAGVWALINGLMWVSGTYFPQWLEPVLHGSRRMLAFSFVFMPFVYAFIFAMFFMAIPAIIVFGDNALAAILRSLRLFLSRPLTILFLAIFILAVPILLGIVASRPSGIVDGFKPELVYWLLVGSLFSDLIANFFWMGTAVRFLSASES